MTLIEHIQYHFNRVHLQFDSFPSSTITYTVNYILCINHEWSPFSLESVNYIPLLGRAGTVQAVRFKQEGGPSINIMTGFSKINLGFFYPSLEGHQHRLIFNSSELLINTCQLSIRHKNLKMKYKTKMRSSDMIEESIYNSKYYKRTNALNKLLEQSRCLVFHVWDFVAV